MRGLLLGFALGGLGLVVLWAVRPSPHPQATSGTTLPSPESLGPSETAGASTLLPIHPAPVAAAGAAPAISLRHLRVEVFDTLAAAFATANADVLLEQLDQAFLTRLDLYAHAVPGTAIDLYLDAENTLVAARVPNGKGYLIAALYRGPHAPAGWYDQKGLSLTSWLRARPLKASRVTSKYGMRLHPISGEMQKHGGVDYGSYVGDPVYAVADGEVSAVGYTEETGNFVELRHRDESLSRYLHLSQINENIEKGYTLRVGNTLGEVGSTGKSTGPHLHFELYKAGVPVPPTSHMPPPTLALGPLAYPAHRALLDLLQKD